MDGAERIFINYRRADTRWAASRLYDGLSQRFGSDTLFMDVDSIPPGADFVDYLNSYVDRSKAIIVLIGPNWLGLRDDRGQRRIDDPDDFVNIEIRRALQNNVTVIPVLVDGAEMPSESDLPEDLKLLSRRQAVKLGHDTYGQDLDRLARALGTPIAGTSGTTPPKPSNVRRPLVWVLGGLGLVLVASLAIIALLVFEGTSHDPAQDQTGQQATAAAIAGRWGSDYGDMIWTASGASYGKDNGQITGTFDGLNFTGHWVEDGSERPCSTKRNGSDAWGTITLTFDASLDFFQGQWGYCDTLPDRPWAGARVKATERAFTSFEENIDRPGGDYTSLRLTNADPVACQKLCSEDQRCLAWTYVAPGYQEASAVCWLKNQVPQATRKDVCCTSGVAYYRRPTE